MAGFKATGRRAWHYSLVVHKSRGHSPKEADLSYNDTMMDSGEHGLLLALLDLSSAFDAVDHDILLTRLSRSFGVCGNVLSWMRSYLSGRIYTVRFGGTESSSRGMLCGVPQGSVLGPLLFVLYTADLGVIADRHGVNSHFYACLLYTSPSPRDRQKSRMPSSA